MTQRTTVSTRYYPHNSRYLCTGECVHYPAYAEAWSNGGSRLELQARDYPDLEPQELQAKARAILLHQIGRR
jgi:hypothetical protein